MENYKNRETVNEKIIIIVVLGNQLKKSSLKISKNFEKNNFFDFLQMLMLPLLPIFLKLKKNALLKYKVLLNKTKLFVR